MKKMLIPVLALALIGGAYTAYATQGYPGPDPEKRMEWLTEVLQLDDTQASKVESIFKEQHEKRMEQMRAMHEQTVERLRGILNDEQMTRFNEMHERRMKHSGRGYGNCMGKNN